MKTKMRDVREAKGLSKSRLSIESGINYATVCQIENGTRAVYPKAAREIAKVLGWQGDPTDLFAEVDDDI